MESGFGKNLLLTLASVALSLALFVGAYEIYKSHRYDAWKAEYERSGDWYGKLTIPSANPVLMWEYRASAQGAKWGSVITTNAHGYRDLERNLEKEDGWRRIAVVGDSVTLGAGVGDEETFVRRLESRVREMQPGPPLEVLGFAVAGYNALQVMELVRERVAPFEPDRVVYVFCMNDFDFDGASAGLVKYFRKPESFFLLRLEKLYKQFFEYHDYYFRKNFAAVVAEIVRTRDLLSDQGAGLDVVLLPVFPEQGLSGYPIRHVHEAMSDALARHDIAVIDLLQSPLSRGNPPRAYARDIWHLNARGHDLVASLLFDQLF